jgi:hypothetical protein
VALDRAVGIAAAVHPGGNGVGRGRKIVGARGVVVRRYPRGGVVRVVAQSRVAKPELLGEILHIEVGLVLDEGLAQ